MAPTVDEYASPAETVALALRVEAEVIRLREENAQLRAEVERLTAPPAGGQHTRPSNQKR